MANDIGQLENELKRLSQATSYPATPPLAGAVRRRLEVETAPRTRMPRRWAVAAAAVSAAVVLGVVLGAWSPGREAVADFFDRLLIFETEESPEGLPAEIIGTPTSLAEAKQRLPFLTEPTYPADLEPERVLFQQFDGFRAAVLFYEHPSGFSFALFETSGVVGKGLPIDRGAEAEAVDAVGDEAHWLTGSRIVEYYDERGRVIEESRRTTKVNALLWREGEVVFRLEGDLSQEEAIRIAQSLR